MVELAVSAAVALIELAAQLAPGIVAAINANGSLSDAQKADLISRVDAAKSKVAAYTPKEV